jgi:hypothetical protein
MCCNRSEWRCSVAGGRGFAGGVDARPVAEEDGSEVREGESKMSDVIRSGMGAGG